MAAVVELNLQNIATELSGTDKITVNKAAPLTNASKALVREFRGTSPANSRSSLYYHSPAHKQKGGATPTDSKVVNIATFKPSIG